MEKENPVEQWINTDQQLSNILIEIQNTEKDERKQAELAFHKIPELYNLPKMPEDNEEELFYSSVYEQLALLNFLEPDGDIRGHVLSAIFYVKEAYMVDIEMVYEKQFKQKQPPSNFLGLGYKGAHINVKPIFIMKGQNWFNLGCKYFTKEIDTFKRTL